ncbi:MAG: FHA domain-containing protein [Acidobacteriota bacterium]|nr:FHA domain-containing protein [Blastocatellia bacterium]MDW8412130.1 FHA domain-containing protein [Acidobacteriota bacterium]
MVQIVVRHVSGLKQGEVETITSFPTTIGRAPGCKPRLAVNDTRASGRHAELSIEDGQLILRDLGSTNGTYISGQRIERVRLLPNDIVEFGIEGPRLKFEFTQDELIGKLRPAVAPVATAASVLKPIIAIPPASSESLEEREFAFKHSSKYLLVVAGAALLVFALILFLLGQLLPSIPTGLLGLFLLCMGWACWRINITVNAKGICHQGMLSSVSIDWQDIREILTVRSKTRLLTHVVYVVRSDRKQIAFYCEDYKDGLELTQIISRRTGLKW